jgi:hypothetical protein
MDIDATSDSLIQMPLIYYPGYRIQAYEDDKKIALESLNIDGLIAFNVAADYQKIVISFVGSPTVIGSYVYFGLSALGTAGLVTWFKLSERKRKETTNK